MVEHVKKNNNIVLGIMIIIILFFIWYYTRNEYDSQYHDNNLNVFADKKIITNVINPNPNTNATDAIFPISYDLPKYQNKWNKMDDWSGYYNFYSDYWPNNYLSYGYNPYKNYFYKNTQRTSII